MARKKMAGFTDVELDVMRALWEKDGCSSDQIRKRMPGDPTRKESTMRTILSVMERKGYVRHDVIGRTFVYYPVIKREVAQKNSVLKILDKVFNGSPKMLLQCIIDTAELDNKTVLEIQELLRANINSKES